jgi:predicted nucleic acid-binding protein
MLKNIPSNTHVFVDSNIFIYHFLDVSVPCTNFLERIEMEDITAYTSTVVLSEVLHRLMIAEVVEKIPEFKVRILSVTSEAIFQSRRLRKEYYLLTKDSLNLYVMKTNDLKDMVTNDSDFDGVEWLNVWKP